MNTIQIIGLRKYSKPNGEEGIKHQLFTQCSSIPAIFENIDKLIEIIPEKERWNLYYTALLCKDPKETGGALRRFHSQNIIPLDIDGIDV